MKKNSSFILIGILIVLIGFSLYIYKSKSRSSTIDGEDRNFSYKDTAAITKIFIADRDGRKAAVVRGKRNWVVNDKYNCRPDAILNLMEMIKNIEVKMPVSKEERQGVIKFMAANAFKLEIYAGDKLVKQYYVGHETPDSEGTYMLLTDPDNGENYADPYVCFIPGFKGYLMPRVITNENEWRDRVVLDYIPPEIKEIKVQHLDSPADSSFSIQLLHSASFSLKNSKGEAIDFDENKIKQYLAYFQNISYEVLLTGANKKLQDSLSLQKPFCVLSLTTVKEGLKVFKFYRKQYAGAVDPELGVNYQFDPDRLFLRFDNDKEWAVLQYFVFGKLFVTPNYFSRTSSVKK